jgi:hypothetical protein
MSDKMSDNNIIAFNQSNYPVLIEVYAVNEDHITFKSNISARKCTNNVYVQPIASRAYFLHFGIRYFLDECMTID